MPELAFSPSPSRTYCWPTLCAAADGLSREWSAHRLLPRGADRPTRFRTLALPQGASINRLRFEADVEVHPVAHADVLLLHMPACGQARLTVEGRSLALDADHAAAVHVRGASQVQYDRGFDMLVLRVPLPELVARLERELQHRLRQPLRFEPAISRGSAAWAAWAPLRAALEALEQPEAVLPAPALIALHDAVSSALLYALPHNHTEALCRPSPPLAPRHVKRAEAFMRANADAALTLAKVADRVGVSMRCLFDGFVATHSMTPAQFLRRLRLDHAHEALRRGDGSVAEVALRCGFRHSGRFASHYRRRFGESPSQTSRQGSAAEP